MSKSKEEIMKEFERQKKKIGVLRGTCYSPSKEWLSQALEDYFQYRLREVMPEQCNGPNESYDAGWEHAIDELLKNAGV